jgi:hypothetical protein
MCAESVESTAGIRPVIINQTKQKTAPVGAPFSVRIFLAPLGRLSIKNRLDHASGL